jgi:4-amino-4-deoxy-L-arabinose transferase-like glycosyltransferase
MLAAILGPLGGGLALLGKVQAVLLAATAAAGYLAAYPLFGRGAALAAGLLIAVYPQTITSATWILSDPPALFLTTAALACLSWLAVRPRWPLALGTGVLFGVGCLVRSAPLYFVPLAAVLLYLAVRGRRPHGRASGAAGPSARPSSRRWSPALALVAGTLLVVLPWCIRNSLLYGKPMGIDDLMIPNFLMAHPDPQILPSELEKTGVWGEAEKTREQYFRKLWRANSDHRLTLDSGRILGRGLLRMAASPGATLARFGVHLKIYFQTFPRLYSAHFLGETEGCRVSWWTDALNLIYLLTLALAVPGAWLALRRRQAWPLVAWILYFVVVTNLFFYPSYMPGRYRLPIYPALAVLAGLTLSRAAGALAAYRLRRPRPGGG